MKDALGNRMKRYEAVEKRFLIPKMPVIIRVDGKAFHTFTRGLERPYSNELHTMMGDAALALYQELQGARLCYFQSDEISILLSDWDNLESQMWFGGNLQKMVSVSASTATAAFIRSYMECAPRLGREITSASRLPMFDSRVFQLPSHEVANYFIWRQQDASKNSLQMLARSHFSHKSLVGKNTSDMHNMLMLTAKVNWNDLEAWKRRGTCVSDNALDEEIPLFTADRHYIERFLNI